MNLCAVVMAGGAGTRLWPLSRANHPKQFLTLDGEDTMLQTTFKRLSNLDIKSSFTICNDEHRFVVAEQLREISKLGSIILEPSGRNTAPAIALAALAVEDDPLLLVLSADHVIRDKKAFSATITKAIPLAESGKLVTFGVVPSHPNTGYGYIKKGKNDGVGYSVEKFFEKPIADVAEEYVSSGMYFWNSGMFLFKASRYLEELKRYRPDIFEACELAMENAATDLDFIRLDKEKFEGCPSESIDYAVMERTNNAMVVPMEAGWSDIGSWASLLDISLKDKFGNSSKGDVILYDTKNSYVRSEDKLVAAVGLDNLVIVSTKDAVLVANKNNVQSVAAVVKKLKGDCRVESELHREVYRPWGKYDLIDFGERYQVKRITVKPGAKLSVQMHNHRAEHWVVVSGTARVTNGDKVFFAR